MKKINKIKKHKKIIKPINNKKEINKITFDIGLAILRAILSFCVVISHCYNFGFAEGKWKQFIENTQIFAFPVPTFIIMSFFFSYKTLVYSDFNKKFERLLRLFIPYILWPIILYYAHNKILTKYLKIGFIPFIDLKLQLLKGGKYMSQFWYQWVLIFLTIVYMIISLLSKRIRNLLLINMVIIALIVK